MTDGPRRASSPRRVKQEVRPRRVIAIVAGVLVVGVLFALAIMGIAPRHGIADLEPGECITISTPHSPERSHEVVSCSGGGLKYQVVRNADDGCGRLTTYSEVEGSASVCLLPVLEQGHCYGAGSGDEIAEFACDSPEAMLRISDVVEGDALAYCNYESDSVFYAEPHPGVTYCLEPPQ